MKPGWWLLSEYGSNIKKRMLSVRQRKPPEKWNHGSIGDVLMIGGWNENWYFLKPIGDALNRAGYRVYITAELRRNFLPLDESLKIVEELVRRHNLRDFYVVGHSKGGLLAAGLVKDKKLTDIIRKVITIATPFGGSELGHLTIYNLKELTPGSLKNNPLLIDFPVDKIVNLYPASDNLVIPNKNLLLPGAKNIRIPVAGHTRILDHPETIKTILREVEA